MKQHPEITWDIATSFDPNPHHDTHVRLIVGFRTGGTNYFSGNREMRGFELTMTPVAITSTGFTCLIGDSRGARFFLEVASKWNAAQLAQLDARLHPHAADLAQLLAAGDKSAIRKRLDDILAREVATLRA